jgi:hypothetical protein
MEERIMGFTAKSLSLIPLSIALAAVVYPAPAQAQPYGPDTCIQGYVWREARPGDTVCVTPPVRTATAQQNAAAAQNVQPGGGAYGPNTCKQGFVWREAYGGDVVCVTPDVRTQAANDNAAAQSRYVRNQPQPTPTPRLPICDVNLPFLPPGC